MSKKLYRLSIAITDGLPTTYRYYDSEKPLEFWEQIGWTKHALIEVPQREEFFTKEELEQCVSYCLCFNETVNDWIKEHRNEQE